MRFILLILFTLQLNVNKLAAMHPDQTGKETLLLHDWKENVILKPTERKPARTAVLIIAAPEMGNCPTAKRWKLGKKVWEQYMNSNPNVDCYFMQCTCPRSGNSEQVWLEGNTIYVGDAWYEKYGSDRLLHKTICAIEWLLPNYTHFIRTNLNIFLDLKNVNDYMETHHQSMFTTPLWQTAWYAIGYSIIFTADVAEHIASEYRRLEEAQVELISPNHADDGALTSLATGVWPYDRNHPFRCCPTLPFGVRQLMCKDSLTINADTKKRTGQHGTLLIPPISLETAIQHCEQAQNTMMLYRTAGGLNLGELAQLYEYLLYKNYPELPFIDLREYVESFH